MTDEIRSDDQTEIDVDGTKLKIPRKKNGSTNGLNGTKAPTDEQLTAFAAAIAVSGRELNVTRVAGPGGKMTYRSNGLEVPVQCADCPEKLPPEAASTLVASIKARYGGGVYRVWVDGDRSSVLYPVKVPGKPLPLDEAQAHDEVLDAEERAEEVREREAERREREMFFGRGAPVADQQTRAPFFRPGFTFDPATGMQIPMAPYHDPRARDLEKENAELRRKTEIDPMARELASLKEQVKTAHAPPPGESPMKGIIEMMQLQQQEAQRQRDHQLAVEDKRAQREADDRKARLELEREEMKARAERDREDRIEREKDRTAMFNMVVKMTLEGGKGKNEVSPIEMVERVMGIAQTAKEMNQPPGKGEVAEIIEAATAGSEKVIGSIGDAVRGRSANPPAGGGAAGPPTQDENQQLLDIMDYMGGLARGKTRPMNAFVAFCAFCVGRGYDQAKMLERLKAFADQAGIDKLKADLDGYAKMPMPEKTKAQITDAAALLAEPEHATWLLEVGAIAKG